jgi:effector-binding domain-containing protein
MKPYKIFGIVLLAVVLIFLIVPVFLPQTFEVNRSITINRSAAQVYAQLQDFKAWEKWSPWLERDPSIINIYSEQTAGEGAKVKWTSENSGSGAMVIKNTEVDTLILINLSINDFAEFESKFVLSEDKGITTVRWSDSGKMGYLGRWLNLFAESMMGSDLSKGLSNLKQYVEQLPKITNFKLAPIEMTETNPIKVYSLLDSCAPQEVSKKLTELYGALLPFLQKNNMESLGAPMAIYYTYTADKVILEAAIPVAENKVKPEGKILARTLPSTTCISASIFGDYKYLLQGFTRMIDSINAYGYEFVGPQFDLYITDPTTVKSPLEIETKMFFPVK